VKRLISIGVALALLSAAVAPVAVAADTYSPPDTYSQIPFAIIGSGFALVGQIAGVIGEALTSTLYGLPLILQKIGVYIGTGVANALNNLTSDTANLGGDICGIVGEETGSSLLGNIAQTFYEIAWAVWIPFGAANWTAAP
jgi:hypothetical protein